MTAQPSASVAPSAPSQGAPAAPAVLSGCTVEAARLQGKTDNDTIKIMARWSPECRWAAFDNGCQTRCFEVLSDLIIKAAPPSESRKIRQERLRRNTLSEQAGDDIVKQAKELHAYGQSIRNTPRNTDVSCISRMRQDFARVDAFGAQVEQKLEVLPIGFVGLKSFASFMKNCLNCGEDRSSCDEAKEDLKIAQDNLKETKKLNALDTKALKN